MATRCCMPPDSVSGYDFSKPESPTAWMRCSTVWRRSCSGNPLIFRPYSTFCDTVSQGNEVYFWKTMPRSRPGAPVTGSPLTRISPEEGWSRPAMMRSNGGFAAARGSEQHAEFADVACRRARRRLRLRSSRCGGLGCGIRWGQRSCGRGCARRSWFYSCPIPACPALASGDSGFWCLVAHALACRGELQFVV
jgi:hypothetical protein